jgi:hypothetical protein
MLATINVFLYPPVCGYYVWYAATRTANVD